MSEVDMFLLPHFVVVATICIVSATADSSSIQMCDVTAIVDKK
jgi:hypothetical protein